MSTRASSTRNKFGSQQVTTIKRALPCGDYGLVFGGKLVAAVERKSLSDLVSSLQNGTLRFALAELASLPRAAVVAEDRYSSVSKLDRVRPAVVADGLAELQVRWAGVPIVFAESRSLAEEWVYRYLAAAHVWAQDEVGLAERLGAGAVQVETGQPVSGPETSEVRTRARANGLPVTDRGRLRPDVWAVWRAAHPGT